LGKLVRHSKFNAKSLIIPAPKLITLGLDSNAAVAMVARLRPRRGNCVLTLAEYCRNIRLLVLDVDGSLTAGGIIYAAGEGSPGLEIKEFFVRDGWAIKHWQRAGGAFAIVTGRRGPVVERRARELGANFLVQGAEDKIPAWEQTLTSAGVEPHQAAVLGDDVPDVPLLARAGLGAAPADACAAARKEARVVLRHCAGRGAARELVELIMRVQGSWNTKAGGN
jgi:YrbI family 3-deoxy-D-manno-octulosonate 8-phosphate phosphatase